MKTTLLFLLLLFVRAAGALEADAHPPVQPDNASALSPLSVLAVQTDRLPGVDLAEGISEITGTAVSPLLGVSAIGAWRYYHAPENLRESLPWFCHPAVWGGCFAILALCFLKDALGTIAPPFIKKPLDMLELFENKLSALVASAAFVPFIASQMARHLKAPDQAFLSLPDGAGHLSLAMFGLDGRLLLVPLCIVSFLVVWVTCHAINVLIALCPFGFVDTLLKLAKMALLSVIILASSISPYLGGVVSLCVIAVAAWLAPAAFRLTVFGALFAADTIMPSRARRLATPHEAQGFIARATAGVPARTYGRLGRAADGTVEFSYRPWLLLPPRSVRLPSGSLALSRGVFFPSLLHCAEQSQGHTRIILFLPRYRTQEVAVAAHLGIEDIRDSSLAKGFKAVRAWFSEVLSFGTAKLSSVRQAGSA